MSKLLLDRGADPNANVYASGWPLRNAWDHDDPSVKNLLLERGAKIQPYMIPEMNDLEATRRLLAEQPSEEVISELAWSAADHGCPEILELALPHLSWPSTDHRWHWVLLQPIRGASSEPGVIERYFRCMEAILKHGANPDLARYGQTMLHFTAARSSDLAGAHRAHFASLLLDYGADVTLRDDLLKSTPLGWACRWGRVEMVRELLRRGAPVDEPDAEPWATPISWAKKMGHEAILKLLLDKRA
jgi:ankyrin repeat protein